MSRQSPIGIFSRGIAMGTADLVPGVSGGTVALITGIYPRLLAAVAAFDSEAVGLLRQGRWRDLWSHVDGGFLLPLMLGIGTAIVALASVLKLLLETQALLVWSFFCGLVLVSALLLVRDELQRLTATALGCMGAGIVVMLFVGLSPGLTLPQTSAGFFLTGMLGISAMILPGISGSFILVLLGMYSAIITAVVDREWSTLALFALGCAAGLLVFSRFLTWLLDRARRPTLSVLVGFLLGSLVILWPWQEILSTGIGRDGGVRVLQTRPVGPDQFELLYGDSQLMACLLSAAMGALLVAGLRVVAQRMKKAEPGDRG